jgi:HAD superfamily hydrolase (TIGR01509 family)
MPRADGRGGAEVVTVPWGRGVRAVVFDTDGVITDSAGLHAAAWKTAFDGWLAEHPPDDPAARRPFDAYADYLAHVDGRSRLEGAATFLASRGVRLPTGTPRDPPDAETVWAVATRKDELFTRRLREERVGAWPGSVRLLRALESAGVPRAAVSASRHARELLGAAGVLDLLPVVVDGVEAARLRLPDKPDPALFVEAAARLGVRVADTAVVEDAVVGVRAGRRGGFRLVVGVDRTPGATRTADLRANGADLVVADPGDLLRAAGGKG